MELKDFNLGMVTIKKPGYYTAFGLYPINDCIFNGERYQGNSEEPTEENMYLRTEGMEHGCIMSVEQTQKAYIIKKIHFLVLYILTYGKFLIRVKATLMKTSLEYFVVKNYL